MSSLSEIRKALATTMGQVGLNVYHRVPDVTQSPAAVILPSKSNYVVAMQQGSDTYEFDVAVLVANVNTEDAQDRLDELVTGRGDRSVRQHLYDNPSLGLSDVDCTVKGFDGYGGSFQSSAIDYVGAVLKVCVVVL